MKKPRNVYITKVVEFYKGIRKRAILKKQLSVESVLCRDQSMKVLAEFQNLEDKIPGLAD